MAEPTLLLMSGSLRTGSYNRMLLAEAATAFGAARVVNADLDLPLYNGDLEEAQGIPDKVKVLGDQIRDTDAMIISTPEYNKGISGVLKNALDWLSRSAMGHFRDKPTVLMSATAGRTGGETALYMTTACLGAFQVRIVSGPPVMVAGAQGQFDDNGKLVQDSYRDALTTRMAGLRALVEATAH
ncbi:MAG: NADPH-dependent FMN reductase [Pseudomonadota bacterium]